MRGSKDLTLSAIVAVSGMTLGASPAWRELTVTTAVCVGSTLPRNDRLQRSHQTAGDHDRVNGEVGPRSVATLAAHRQRHGVGGGHDGPRAGEEGARRRTGMVVKAENCIAGKSLEEPVGDHALCAAVDAGLFGGLEHKVHGAGEAARAGEVFSRAEQHGRMPVVAAGVHPARHLARIRQARLLGDGKRVHVGPDRDAARGRRRP